MEGKKDLFKVFCDHAAMKNLDKSYFDLFSQMQFETHPIFLFLKSVSKSLAMSQASELIQNLLYRQL